VCVCVVCVCVCYVHVRRLIVNARYMFDNIPRGERSQHTRK
jgi:hypothetical protein